MVGYALIAGIMFLIGIAVSSVLKRKFREYSEIPLQQGLSGREVAEKMLRDNGIYDVQVVSGEGFLSDHYNPADKTVTLSPDIYSGRSISSAAVAAHECGHALQHAQAYSMLTLRSRLVPATQIATSLTQWIFIFGFGFMVGKANPIVLLIAIALYGIIALFSLVTLPVEYDASARALKWMENTRLTTSYEHDKAADALKWAARTYVVAAISSVATVLYFIMIFVNGRRD